MIMLGDRRRIFRRKGDQARDRGQWNEAEVLYRRHLEIIPDDAAIHVQLGHVLAQQGRIGDAADAYAAGVELDANTDALIHLGDALVRCGRWREASIPFGRARAMADDPTTAAWLERLAARTIFFAVQDLIEYLRHHVAMSGIQRFQAGIITQVAADMQIDAGFIMTEIGARPERLGAGEYWRLPKDTLLALLDYAQQDEVDHDRLRLMIGACEQGARRVRPAAGNVALVLGAFWGLGGAIEGLRPAKDAGVLVGVFIQDIIPLTHPDYCEAGLTSDFAMSFCEVVYIADFVLTNSAATRRTICNFLDQHRARPLPVHVVRLSQARLQRRAKPCETSASPEQVARERFALCVGTIEIRKNHLYLVECWRRLIEDAVDVPEILLVGRVGWKVAPLFELLEETNYLNGKVRILDSISDHQLEALYRTCEFTVFASFVEGWGLPIGESLAYGKPCVASRQATTKEAGGPYVDLIDPDRLDDGVEVLRRMISDAAYRSSRERMIAEKFVPRNWSAVAADLVSAIAQAAERGPSALQHLMVAPGQLIAFKRLAPAPDLDLYLQCPTRLLLPGRTFHRPDDRGARLRGSRGAFEVPTSLPAGSPAFLFLLLDCPASVNDCEVRLHFTPAAGGPDEKTVVVRTASMLDGTRATRLAVRADERGILSIDIEVRHDHRSGIEPDIVNLSGFAYARAGDHSSCARLIAELGVDDDCRAR